jgi:cytidylate kinase
MKSTNRLVGEQLLRDFAARDAKDMRRYAKEMEVCPESTYVSGMYYYHKASYNTYKHALQVVNTPIFWEG